MIVADTDVLIDSTRGREPMRSWIATAIQQRALATTVINAFELLGGARAKADYRKVDALLGGIDLYPLDEAAMRVAAGIRRNLEVDGMSLEAADCLIAGICIARSVPLLTRNRAHFERVQGLVLAPLP